MIVIVIFWAIQETSGDEAAKSPGTQSEDTAAMTTPTEPMSPESNTECGEVEKGEKKEETTEKVLFISFFIVRR